jgi:hypothetical protein
VRRFAPAGWPTWPGAGLIPRAHPFAFLSPLRTRPFSFSSPTLGPPNASSSSFRRPPPPAAVGEPRPDYPCPHHLLPLLIRFRPPAASPSARSSSLTCSSLRRRRAPPRRRSPPRLARPCRGRASPLRRTARSRAAPARSRPLPLLRLLASTASRRAHARLRAGHAAGVRWPRPWRAKATAGLDFAWVVRWPPGPACWRPGALDPGGSSACCPFSFCHFMLLFSKLHRKCYRSPKIVKLDLFDSSVIDLFRETKFEHVKIMCLEL